MDPEKILVIRLSSLGDIVNTLPAVARLKQRHPKAEIDWLVATNCVNLLEHNPDIARIIPWDRDRWRKKRCISALKEFRALIRTLRSRRYDLVYDFQDQFRSGLISFLSKSPRRIGFDGSRELNSGFYTEKVSLYSPRTLHYLERNLLLCDFSLDSPKEFHIVPTGADKDHVQRFLGSIGRGGSPLICISPSARWESKRWPADRFSELAHRLVTELNAAIIFIGSAQDSLLVDKIASFRDFPYLNATGATTLRQLAHLLSLCDLLITNDSGPMHLAAAMRVPTVSIFGPTDPKLTGPYGQNHAIITSDIECASCGKRRCPRNIECLRSISAERILRETRRLLHRPRRNAFQMQFEGLCEKTSEEKKQW